MKTLIGSIEKAFGIEYENMGEFLNGRLLLYQDKSNKKVYYVLNSKASLKQGSTVNIIKDVEYYKNGDDIFAICDQLDIAVTKVIYKKKKKKHVNYDPAFLPKLFDMVSKLYQMDPEYFIDGFKHLRSNTLLHAKMIKKYPEYNDRRLMYDAIDFASDMIEKGEPNVEAIRKASEHYDVPIEVVTSMVQTRMVGFRINYS